MCKGNKIHQEDKLIMCLISLYSKPRKETHPITCYKVLLKCVWKDNGACVDYVTPYQRCLLEDSVVGGEVNMVACGDDKVQGVYNSLLEIDEYIVDGGYVHCHSNLQRAIDDAIGFSEGVVFECEIPAGIEYFKDGFCHEICAREIKFIKQVY